MNCANHVDVPATAYCRTCGKPVCSLCARDVRGVIYCEDCLASQVSGTTPPPAPGTNPPGAPAVSGGSPGLAALLGFIPGVGAMYNGEYAKGFVHVLIFATLIWATDHLNSLFGMAIAAFCIYMPIEAYQTAKARQLGLPPPDAFGFNNLFGTRAAAAAAAPGAASATGTAPVQGVAVAPVAEEPAGRQQIPIGAYVLIGVGVLFLLGTFGWMHFEWIGRFWPLILIAVGVRVLMKRNRMGY